VADLELLTLILAQMTIKSTEHQDSTNPPLLIADVSRRFFFFTYAYWCEKTEGKGNLSLTSKIGFPTQKDVKQKAIEQVKNRYDEPEYKISVVIESWIEMSEDDYNQWLS
jgi:hypothetical protein